MHYLFFLVPLLLFGQDQNNRAEAIEQAVVVFERDLMKVFIHPDQLDEKNSSLCRQYIEHILDRYTVSIVSVRFERAFKNSDATNIFKPIFLLANKQEVQMPNFKIMQ